MITYVNSVFVSNNGTVATSLSNLAKGQLVFWDIDANASVSATITRFKVGMGTGKTMKQLNPQTKKMDDVPVIKWSNIINVADIKGWTAHTNSGQDTEDTITIDFTSLDPSVLSKFAEGGKRIIVRLTFKDTPTRYRKWTESYEYVTQAGDTNVTIADNVANMINKEWKRARVDATANAGVVTLVAMKYDDDESVDSINWYNKVRFNANVYYTDPAAEGWESKNKLYPTGVTINKVPGKTDQASAKLVRDREAQAMGYLGILNRGEGTWPIIKPEMETNLNNTYNSVVIEFENIYRAADDIFRKTKQSVEVYTTGTTKDITDKLDVLVNDVVDKTIEG